ncbi:hypothetical protein ALP8811_00206 [Aliiroseovarius pelagivivens]|uniref:Uncharacterized protein n=2 Tax=Aliiroseovarius pelagivivens TaxID=1639690 RepID=A0A2R8AGR2_9RHOB|nr:hypothetical protein ALP8811_00206 [Aliiroseovarius pelagivivens]
MHQLTNEQLIQLWKRSIALANAPYRFAHPNIRASYDAACSESATEAMKHAADSIQESGKSGIEAMTELFAGPSRILGLRSEISSRMKSNLVKGCESGALRAFAFETPRKLEHTPVELPPSVWSGHIDWARSQIKTGGLCFVEVRLISPKIAAEIEAKYLPQEAKSGRPAIEHHLRACVQEMANADLIDPTQSMRSHYDAVRVRYAAYANTHKLTKTNVGDEAIRKVFSPIYKDLKENQKL